MSGTVFGTKKLIEYPEGKEPKQRLPQSPYMPLKAQQWRHFLTIARTLLSLISLMTMIITACNHRTSKFFTNWKQILNCCWKAPQNFSQADDFDISINHDLVRSCFQLWPKFGDEGNKTNRRGVSWDSFFLEILSPSEPILRAKIENMISPDYVLCYIPWAIENFEKKLGKNWKFWKNLENFGFFLENFEL